MEELGLTPSEVTDLLNHKSGLLGLCGANDMRDVVALAQAGNLRAHVAREMFVYRIQKYIGAYAAVLNGIDLVVFTGGIGEKDPEVRERVTANLAYLGAHVDREKNERNAPVFSSEASRVTLLTIAANEERVIAQHTHELLTQSGERSARKMALGSPRIG
jgi:acetate kinase